MTIYEDQVSTDVEQEHNGAIADMRLIRRPENVTEANLADVFADQLKDKAVFCFEDKHWYLWNGERWQKDKQKQILLRASEFAREVVGNHYQLSSVEVASVTDMFICKAHI